MARLSTAVPLLKLLALAAVSMLVAPGLAQGAQMAVVSVWISPKYAGQPIALIIPFNATVEPTYQSTYVLYTPSATPVFSHLFSSNPPVVLVFEPSVPQSPTYTVYWAGVNPYTSYTLSADSGVFGAYDDFDYETGLWIVNGSYSYSGSILRLFPGAVAVTNATFVPQDSMALWKVQVAATHTAIAVDVAFLSDYDGYALLAVSAPQLRNLPSDLYVWPVVDGAVPPHAVVHYDPSRGDVVMVLPISGAAGETKTLYVVYGKPLPEPEKRFTDLALKRVYAQHVEAQQRLYRLRTGLEEGAARWVRIRLSSVSLEPGDALAPHLYDWYFDGVSGSLVISGVEIRTPFSFVLSDRVEQPTGYGFEWAFVLRTSGAPWYGYTSLTVEWIAGLGIFRLWSQGDVELTVSGDVHGLAGFSQVVAQFNGTHIELYRDGTLVGSREAVPRYAEVSGTLYVYAHGGGGGHEPGYLRYLIVYSGRSLEPSEMLSIRLGVVSAANATVLLDPTFFNGTHYVNPVGAPDAEVRGNVVRAPADEVWIWVVRGLYDDGYLHLLFFPYGSVVRIYDANSGKLLAWLRVVGPANPAGLVERLAVPLSALNLSERVDIEVETWVGEPSAVIGSEPYAGYPAGLGVVVYGGPLGSRDASWRTSSGGVVWWEYVSQDLSVGLYAPGAAVGTDFANPDQTLGTRPFRLHLETATAYNTTLVTPLNLTLETTAEVGPGTVVAPHLFSWCLDGSSYIAYFIPQGSYVASRHVYIPSNVTAVYIRERSGNTLTDYSVRIVLDSSWAGWSNVSDTGSDIYFTTIDGRPLYYWVEYFNKSARYAILWVRVPRLEAYSSTIVLLHYGGDNPYTSYNDPHRVFLFYEDAETWSGWYKYAYGYVVQDDEYAYDGLYSVKKDGYCDPSGGYKPLGVTISVSSTLGVALEAWNFRPDVGRDCPLDRFGLEDDDFNGYTISISRHDNALGIDVRTSGRPSYAGTTVELDFRPYFVRLVIFRGRQEAYVFSDVSMTEVVGRYVRYDSHYHVFTRLVIHGGRPYWLDHIRVRWYVEPEPSVELGLVAFVGRGYGGCVQYGLVNRTDGTPVLLADPTFFDGAYFNPIDLGTPPAIVVGSPRRVVDAEHWLWVLAGAVGDELVHLRGFPLGTVVRFYNASSGELVAELVVANATTGSGLVVDYAIRLSSGTYRIVATIAPHSYRVIRLSSVSLEPGDALAPHLYDWYFDGRDDYIEVSPPITEQALPIAVETAVRYTTFRQGWYGVVDWDRDSVKGFWLLTSSVGNELVVGVGDGAAMAETAIPMDRHAGRWLHIHVNVFSDHLDVYLNSVKAVTVSYGFAPVLPTDERLFVGARGSTHEFSRGLVAFVRVYSRALAEGEVSEAYGRRVVNASGLALFLDPTFFNGTHYVNPINETVAGVPRGGVERVPADEVWIWVVRGLYDDGYLHLLFFPYGSVVRIYDTGGRLRYVFFVSCTPNAVGLCEDVRVFVPRGVYTIEVLVPWSFESVSWSAVSSAEARDGRVARVGVRGATPLGVAVAIDLPAPAFGLTTAETQHAFSVWSGFGYWLGGPPYALRAGDAAVQVRFRRSPGQGLAIAVLNVTAGPPSVAALVYTNGSWLYLYYAPDRTFVNTSIRLGTGWYLLTLAFERPCRVRVLLGNGSYVPGGIYQDEPLEFVYNASACSPFLAVYGVGVPLLAGEPGAAASVLYDWARVVQWPVRRASVEGEVRSVVSSTAVLLLAEDEAQTLVVRGLRPPARLWLLRLGAEPLGLSVGSYVRTVFGLVVEDPSPTLYTAVGNGSWSEVGAGWSEWMLLSNDTEVSSSGPFLGVYVEYAQAPDLLKAYGVAVSEVVGGGSTRVMGQHRSYVLGAFGEEVAVAVFRYGWAYLNVTSARVYLCVEARGCAPIAATATSFVLGLGAFYDRSTNSTTFYALYVPSGGSFVARAVTVEGDVAARPFEVEAVNATVLLDRFCAVYGLFARLLATGEARLTVRGPFPMQTMIKMVYLDQPTVIEFANGSVLVRPGGSRGITLVGFSGFKLTIAVGAVTASNIPVTSDSYTIDVPLGYTAMLVVDPVNMVVTIMSATPVQPPATIEAPEVELSPPPLAPAQLRPGSLVGDAGRLLWYGVYAAIAVGTYVLGGDVGLGIAVAGAVASIVGAASGDHAMVYMGVVATVVGAVLSLALRRS